MKKSIICLTVSVFALVSTLQAENTAPKAPAPKPVVADKTAACCDSDCDGKSACSKKVASTKPVAMSPKAAQLASK